MNQTKTENNNNHGTQEKEFRTSQGAPLPFGATFENEGVNFAVFSKNASAVTLALFLPDQDSPLERIQLSPVTNKTGDVWHVFVYDVPEGMHYGFYIDGPDDPTRGHRFNPKACLIDTRAKLLSSSTIWGNEDPTIRGVLINPPPFDWKQDKHPSHPLEEMVIYEMHVRGFTHDPSSETKHPGTFLGIIEKIPYLKSLGVNAIELLPIHSFNECEHYKKNPIRDEQLYNYWGYSTLNFFAPMNKYASDKLSVLTEFKTMVAALHSNGIEIILDVVFNHTSEGNEHGPTLSFRGFENSIYYMLTPNGEYYNYSGCGNTLNCNYPAVRELIRDVLRYWVSEMHVDGFRFDLASILGRAGDGTPLSSPPLLEGIALDPILGKTKLIAEAWDAGGLYQVGSFPSWGVWAEWNGKYRDDVRSFIKGSDNASGRFATRLCGSADLYASSRTPGHSINFITAHDGFSLRDLVSYNEKHNLENGEDNRDGTDQNDSWNCGAEGETDNKDIKLLRDKQERNFFMALLLSQGVPMIHMGDESGHTKKGNNNTWCHDNELNWLSWDKDHFDKDLFKFASSLIHFRKKHRLLRQREYVSESHLKWHGVKPFSPCWEPHNRLVAYVLFDQHEKNDLYIAFNADYKPVTLTLPRAPLDRVWHRIVDTGIVAPHDFIPPEDSKPLPDLSYTMQPYSSLLLKAMPTL